MSSTLPSCELDNDAILTLAALRGWNVVHDKYDGVWYLSRPIGVGGVEMRVGHSREETINHLTKE